MSGTNLLQRAPHPGVIVAAAIARRRPVSIPFGEHIAARCRRFPSREQHPAHRLAAFLVSQRVGPTRRLFQELLGLRLTEQIVFDDGSEVGAWLAATNKSYDVAVTQDRSGAAGRLHHLTYMMDSREDVLRAADILVDSGVTIRRTAQAQHRADLLSLLLRAGRQSLRDRRRRLSDPRPGLAADRLESGRAREGTGLGPADRQLIPHVRDSAGAVKALFDCTLTRPRYAAARAWIRRSKGHADHARR